MRIDVRDDADLVIDQIRSRFGKFYWEKLELGFVG